MALCTISPNEFAEVLQARHGAGRLRFDQFDCHPGDALCGIADAFDVGDGLDDREHQTQIACGGLTPRENATALFVEIDLELIDVQIAADHRSGHVLVTGSERGNRVADLLFDHAAHREHAAAQIVEFLIELAREVTCEFAALPGHVESSLSINRNGR